MFPRIRPFLGLLAVLALAPLAGCGGGSDEPSAELETVMVYYAMPG